MQLHVVQKEVVAEDAEERKSNKTKKDKKHRNKTKPTKKPVVRKTEPHHTKDQRRAKGFTNNVKQKRRLRKHKAVPPLRLQGSANPQVWQSDGRS